MKPYKGDVYKHTKGGLYKVIAIAVHSETKESLVIYQSVADSDRIWARPLPEFCDGRFSKFDFYEGCCPHCGSEHVFWDDDADAERCQDCDQTF